MTDLSKLLSLFTFLAAHTGALIWFLSGTKTTLQHVARQIEELRSELGRVRSLEARVDRLEVKFEALEGE